MQAARYLFLSVALAALLIPVSIHAESGKPSFDCSKAESDAEKLVCSDEQLALLDRELARIYKLAINNPTLDTKGKKHLRASQRGWIKGRDEAWKVKDKKRYVSDVYLLRIAEIRKEHPVSGVADSDGISTGPIGYDCSGKAVEAYFVQILPPQAIVYDDNSSFVCTLVSSASGSKYVGEYENGRVEFWNKGKEAMLTTLDGKQLQCNEAEK